jgi:signal transduction histidine kinase/ligand-binding sensor domain-containing protein/DNA-binding response OmpR family regulator
MNKHFKIFIGIIILSFSQNVYSQFNPPKFDNITVKDGLPENSVTCILQDYLGYLWLGTENGLARYDGYSMKVFQLEGDNRSHISEKGIVTIYEDKNKTLWVGTINSGLFKLDRTNESFKNYKFYYDDSTSLNSDQTHCVYEDSKGRFWIGTSEGLNLFDRNKGTFTRYYFWDGDFNSRHTPKPNHYNLCVNAITEDPVSGKLLIGTEKNGLWFFNPQEKVFSKYKFSDNKNYDIETGFIQSFYKDRDGKIWITSSSALSSLDPKSRIFKSHINVGNGLFTKVGFVWGSVVEDRDGLIWSGFFTGEEGVFCLNPATENIKRYNLFPEKPKKANYNKIYSLYEDRSGIIWIGTWGMGLMKLDKRKNKFQILRSDPNNFSNSLSHSVVYQVIYDPKGFLWFCTRISLDKYDIRTGTYKHYLKNEECIKRSLTYGIQDKSGNLWLGTASCGLIRFDPIAESYRFFLNDPKESENLINKPIVPLIQDHLGFLWIGTEGFGLYKYDILNNKVTHYQNDPNDQTSLSNNVVREIYEDSFGTIWIGTNNGGLNKFERKTEKFSYICLNSIAKIYEDTQKNFWVTDYYTGLNLFNRENGTITATYSLEDGLPSNFILGILEDDNNNLWLETQNGLSKFNTISRTFRNYYKEDGLPEWLSIESICSKGPGGEMYLNTSGGEIVFNPDSIKDDPTPPQVVLSKISLFNRPGEKLSYEGFISELKEITLPYDQNDLRFDYAGLHFSAPEKNRYKYTLENFENVWVNAGTQRNATYTNLAPGEYIFRVTASNKDGVWNETGTSIKIIILPPWWKTWWAYIFYVMIIGSILYFTWKLQLKRIRAKHEFEMSRFETQKLHEVDEIKSRFFTNISHEFRTPLTLILGPVKQIIERIKDEKTKDELGMVHRNANKLLGLVNQLLDISKLESGNMKLLTIPQNIIPFLKALVLSFTSYAERKRITLKLNSTEDEIIVYVDKDKIEKIITNILSNAFKFTPEGGRIEVTVASPKSPPTCLALGEPRRKEGTFENVSSPPLEGRGVGKKGADDTNHVKITISDSGIGIPKEKISKIFDRFYQVDGSHTREQEGTGIGLSLTKELVELHNGKIEVESEESKGTTFTISFPLGKEHLKQEEICEQSLSQSAEGGLSKGEGFSEELIFPARLDSIVKSRQEGTKATQPDISLITETAKPFLLIVEDNSDVRNYIKDKLKKDFRVLEAVDGEDGWNKAIDPAIGGTDLIVSDVMMPRMDGFQLCNKLKVDERTSHIPVILLTAKAASADKIEGFETGADDYIMKPFDPEELRARIKNLIEQRKRIQEHFQKKGLFELNQTKITSVDKKFLQKAFEIITKNISDTSFTIETFAENLYVSKSLLHKKIVSLTGEPPVELIRRIRLKKAAELIEKNFGNLSEIALEVGFNNPAYFSECFKKQFGVSPSQYHPKNTNS